MKIDGLPTNESYRPYTTVLLDVDGTLLDFDEAERRGVRAVMKAYEVEPTKALEQRYHEINNKYWKAFERGEISKDAIMDHRYVDFFKTLGMNVHAADVERLYREQLDSCAILIDGALDLCAYLKERYQLYIVTNGVSDTQYRRLKDSGLDQYFADIFVSEDSGSQKPKIEYFNYCFARISEPDPARMIIIGDSLTSDIQGGKNAGMTTCWVNLGGHPRIAGIKPDYEVRRLAEIKKIL